MDNDNPVIQAIHRRATIENFDPSRKLDEALIRALVSDARRRPDRVSTALGGRLLGMLGLVTESFYQEIRSPTSSFMPC